MNFWQANECRIDPWGEGYGIPVDLDDSREGKESDLVDLEAEVQAEDWEPCKPSTQLPLPNQLIFIDGRRRLDAWIPGRNMLCGAATVAVGAVRVDLSAQTAVLQLPLVIKRLLVFGGDCQGELPAEQRIPCPLGNEGQLVYHHYRDLDNSDNPETMGQSGNRSALLQLVQKEMRHQEVKLAQALSKQQNALVIQDGNLYDAQYRKPRATVGYVKTMQKRYLPESHADLLLELAPGERTPLFGIGQPQTPGHRWSWYLRSGDASLSPKRLGYHRLYGLVRLEVYSNSVPLDRAIAIANQSTVLIPRYASHPTRDPRAPQNLTPVGALEKELGRHMGDRNIIARRIHNFLIAEGANA